MTLESPHGDFSHFLGLITAAEAHRCFRQEAESRNRPCHFNRSKNPLSDFIHSVIRRLLTTPAAAAWEVEKIAVTGLRRSQMDPEISQFSL